MSEKLVEVITSAMEDIKAHKITVMDLREIENSICQFFVISHGNSNTHVSSIAQLVEKSVKEVLSEQVFRKEGYRNSEWILLDFSNVVVHVFQEHVRNFYNLEALWADAKITEIEEA